MPPTGEAAIDKPELIKQLARSNCEMAHNVQKGTYPIFGYPLLCLDQDCKAAHKRSSYTDEAPAYVPKPYWQLMLCLAMKGKKGQDSEFQRLLNGHDLFNEKHENLLKKFSTGKLNYNAKSAYKGAKIEPDRDQDAYTVKYKRGIKERNTCL